MPTPTTSPSDSAHGAEYASLTTFLVEARTRGLMTIAMTADGVATSAQTPVEASADYWFDVPTDDPEIAQEVQETTYHVLWELVHVFFEHPGLLEEPPASAAPGERAAGEPARERTREPGDAIGASGFLYPFLGSEETDLDSVLADVRSSTVRKGADVVELRRAIDVEAIERCAADIRERLEHGGRLIAFGNGGSSTDAQDVAGDLLARGWPAVALNNDVATITAVGNDVGYDNVFARQVIALGRGDDIGLAISTSGSSPNVIAALEEARRRRMLTIAVTGYDGGRCAELPWLDHLFVVESDYIPRLQEAHATIYHLLLEVVGGWGMR